MFKEGSDISILPTLKPKGNINNIKNINICTVSYIGAKLPKVIKHTCGKMKYPIFKMGF